MSKWTPGPWNYPEHPKGVSTLIYAELGGNPEAFPVASATYGVPDEERKANARLIAAAPELLAIADQAANGTLLDDASNHDDDSLRTIAFRISDQWAKRALLAHADRIDAAIAKATGESQ